VKSGLLPAAPRSSVVLSGDILPNRKLLIDSVSRAVGLTLVRCSEDRETVLTVCRRLDASVLIARHEFIDQLVRADLVRLTNHGSGTHLVATLEIDNLEASAKMLRLGCRGVLPRRFSPKLLRRAVLAILDGEVWAPRRVISGLLLELLKDCSSNKDENGLTPQEQRILELSVQGYKNSAIAAALFISTETVRWHKRRLYRKIGKSGAPRYPQSSQGTSSSPGLAAG